MTHPLSGRRSRFVRTAIKHADAERPFASTGLCALKRGSGNGKLGKGRITRGPWIGRRIYALSLEERATCWAGCGVIDDCYGDNMPFAWRYVVEPALYAALRRDLATLSRRHPEGFVVRLHVLGDFRDTVYARFWGAMVDEFPLLAVFGYTHWPEHSVIGRIIDAICDRYPERFAIMRSDGPQGDSRPRAVVVASWDLLPPGVVACPEMTGKTVSCATCGLCMNGRTSVGFIDHSQRALRARRLIGLAAHTPSTLSVRTAAERAAKKEVA